MVAGVVLLVLRNEGRNEKEGWEGVSEFACNEEGDA